MRTVHDLPDLPTELFLSVTCYLDPIDVVRCRLVSESLQKRFIDKLILCHILVRDYSEAQGVYALFDLEVEHMGDKSSGDEFDPFRNIWKWNQVVRHTAQNWLP